MSGKDKTIGINDYLAHLDDDQFRAALLRKLQEQLQTRIKRDKKRNFRALRTAVVGWAKPSRRRSLLIPKEQTFSQRLTSAVGSDSKFRIHFDFDCFKRMWIASLRFSSPPCSLVAPRRLRHIQGGRWWSH